MSALVAALAAAVAATMLVPVRRRLPATPEVSTPAEDVGGLRRLRPLVAAGCAIGGWVLLGGALGLLAGGGAAWLCWRVLGSAEGPAAARRREQLARDLPTGVDLLAACVEAGSSVEPALSTVADALGGPLAEELAGVQHRLGLGVDPATAWRGLEADELRPLVRAVLRAHESGAGVAAAITRLADDLREQARSEVLARAGSVEVRAAAPLGVCFLPAFVLLTVVPLVAVTFSGIALF